MCDGIILWTPLFRKLRDKITSYHCVSVCVCVCVRARVRVCVFEVVRMSESAGGLSYIVIDSSVM